MDILNTIGKILIGIPLVATVIILIRTIYLMLQSVMRVVKEAGAEKQAALAIFLCMMFVIGAMILMFNNL